MNKIREYHNNYDIFILINLAFSALIRGAGEYVLPIIKFIQEICPHNAGPFLLEAMHKYSDGRIHEAIQFIETNRSFYAAVNGDEAVAFHLFLLQQDGQLKRAHDLGRIYMNEGLIMSDSAQEMVRIVTIECEAELGRLAGGSDNVL